MDRRNILVSGVATIMHSFIVPLFSLVFIAFYKPFSIQEMLQMEHATFTFNLTILFSIVFVSVSITRGWLYLLGKYRNVSRPVYAAWCLGEIVVASLFVALYMVLMIREPKSFFDVAGTSLGLMLSTCIYPYAFLWLGLELYGRNKEEQPVSEDRSLIRFHDEYRKLRFVIAPEAVIFIKSEDNYVQIHYTDQGRPKKFILRSSMRALEENLSKHGLVRCHRSYFINPSFIRIVHRDSAGLIVAELKTDGYESIPISRKYQEEITRLL